MDPTVEFLINGESLPFINWWRGPSVSDIRDAPGKDFLIDQRIFPGLIGSAFINPDAIVWANLDSIFTFSTSPVDQVLASYRVAATKQNQWLVIDDLGAAEYLTWRNDLFSVFLVSKVSTNPFYSPIDRQILPITSLDVIPPMVLSLAADLTRRPIEYINKLLRETTRLFDIETVVVLRFRLPVDAAIKNLLALIAPFFDEVCVFTPFTREHIDDRYFIARHFDVTKRTLFISTLHGGVVSPGEAVSGGNAFPAYFDKQIQNKSLIPEGTVYLPKLYGHWAITSDRWKTKGNF